MVATAVLSVLLVGATELVLAGQHAYAQGTSQAFARTEAQKALDQCVKDLRGAAAWTFATDAGGTITPLTAWSDSTDTLSFSFGPRPNVLFYRVVDAQLAPGVLPPYLVLDFEPKGLGTGAAPQDVSSNGTSCAGRMDDDQLKARVELRTRASGGRIVFERLLSPTNDASNVGSPVIPESAIEIADLGPATLPGGVSPGSVSFETAAPGVILVKARASTFVDQRGKGVLVSSEIETQVALTALAPPH